MRYVRTANEQNREDRKDNVDQTVEDTSDIGHWAYDVPAAARQTVAGFVSHLL